MPTLMARVLLMHYGGLFAATAAGACGCSREVGPLNNAGRAADTYVSHQKRDTCASEALQACVSRLERENVRERAEPESLSACG
jgi:hypothetical protein